MGHQLDTSCPLPQPVASASSLLAQVSREAVVGSFQMADNHFLIVAISQLAQSAASGQAKALMQCQDVAGQFEEKNQKYLIVKANQAARQTDTEPTEPALAAEPIQAQLDVVQCLTERELQIAALIAHGWSNKQTAAHLAISEWTVATHLRRIFMKLQVDSRAAMVYKCAGLIQQQLS